MISVDLARRLRAAGVAWSPASGDRFVVPDRDMDAEVFVISDMTVEVQELVDRSVIGFNGTTEWAMDSLEVDDALWLPREDQLRTLLGTAFVALTATDDGYRVDARVGGRALSSSDTDVERAYAAALLAVHAEVAGGG